MRVEHQVRAFEQILKSYDGAMPLHRFLFAHFRQNKQMGSSDRRWATRYCYSFFRLGTALPNLPQVQRLAIADFLCHQVTSLVIEHYLEGFTNFVGAPLEEKIALVKSNYPDFELEGVFKWSAELSETVDKNAFLRSFFIQPDLFIRVDAKYASSIEKQLTDKGISIDMPLQNTFALPNGTKLEGILGDSQHFQVQDLSSQKTGDYFKPNRFDYWWDCCAASGGKSLLLHSLEPQIDLLVSDIRENSLTNLDERFKLAGIKKYQKKVLDLLQNNDPIIHHYEFDGILLDAPCSGSGTWGRTPEMLCYFETFKIANYAKLQKAIAANVIKYLKPGKPLIYMTCSVFKAENEDVVSYLIDNFPLELEQMELIKGYEHKADSMFVARLIKKS